MRTVQFSAANGDRPSVRDVAIVITDGESTVDKDYTVPEAMMAHNRGIHVIAIGITDKINEMELRAISSQPQLINETYFMTTDFTYLRTVVDDILNIVCQVDS